MSSRKFRQPSIGLSALELASRVFQEVDSPYSLGCDLAVKYGDFASLVSTDIDSKDYTNPKDFFRDYLCQKLLSAYPYLNTGIDTKRVALDKFNSCEEECKKTNERFRSRERGLMAKPSVERTLSRMQRKISLILGEVPQLESLHFAFGPGANLGVRKFTSVLDKVTTTLECTYAFSDRLQEFLEEFPGWIPEGNHAVRLEPGSQLTFVPKNAKTDRPICIEPLLNGLYQKGFGSYIRDRLKRFGIDLRDQTQNQTLAGQAFERNLSTVDFSSASDTISYNLVLDLLPIDWFEALDVARCPRYIHDGVWRNFHKFSSMGNAYTFELETLIFFAMASAVCEEEGISYSTGNTLSVYGDDVIIPRGAFHLFQEVAEYCGFSVNGQKSFIEGSFFESCGHDFFNGSYVRPYRIKIRVDTLLGAIYAANTIRRLQRILFHLGDSDLSSRFAAIHSWIVAKIPRPFRVYGPDGAGDGHLISEFDECRPQRHPNWDAWLYSSYAAVPTARGVEECPSGYALYFTAQGSTSRSAYPVLSPEYREPPLPPDNGRRVTVRGYTSITRRRQLSHFEWVGWKPLGMVT